MHGTVQAQDAPLFAIPTESELTGSLAAGAPARVALYARDLNAVAEALGIATPDAAAERIEYVTAPYPQLPSPARRSWRESTFVVDFEEAAVGSLREKFVGAHGEHLSGQALTAFVAGEISESKYRGWDVASVVATNLEGDCTEYAVLLAALARSVGLKARVAVGVALVSTEAGHAAYGHAWTELEDGGRWVVADAALLRQQAQVRYMPLGLLIDEGPGYSLDLVRISNHWIQRVIVLPLAPAPR